MSKVRKFLTVGGTFSTALAIGYVMQNGDALAARFVNANAEAEVIIDDPTSIMATSGPNLLTPITSHEPIQIASPFLDKPLGTEPLPTLIAAVAPDTAFEVEDKEMVLHSVCDVHVSTSVNAHAMVLLDVYAPCAPNERFTLHHKGMMFTQSTDAMGAARLNVPALAEISVFAISFDNGLTGVASAAIPEVTDYERAVLQFESSGDLRLHALLNGTDYSKLGNSWSDSIENSRLIDFDNGFLMKLGDPDLPYARLAQIYSFQTDQFNSFDSIEVSVEAEITLDNCGRELAAQSLQVGNDGELNSVDLVMMMPDCDAVGDLLILGNMFSEIEIASSH